MEEVQSVHILRQGNLHILKYEKEDLEDLSNYQVQYEFKDQEGGCVVKICTLIGKPLTVILIWDDGTTEGVGLAWKIVSSDRNTVSIRTDDDEDGIITYI